MHAEIYSDGVNEITVSGTVVRVDLFSLSPTERDENNTPKPAFRQRLIFSIEGFANSVEVMQKALQGLIQAGAVSRTPGKAATATPPRPHNLDRDVTVQETPQMADTSPNFPRANPKSPASSRA